MRAILGAAALCLVTTTARAEAPSADDQQIYRVSGWIVAGVAAGALAVDVLAFLRTNHYEDEAYDRAIASGAVGDPCDAPAAADACRSGERWATVAQVAVLATVPAAMVAGILLYRGYSTPAVTPVVGPGTVGAAATITF